MLSRIKSILTRNKIGAISIQVATDSRETHRRQVRRVMLTEREYLEGRIRRMDGYIAAATAGLSALAEEREQLGARYAALAIELSHVGAPGLVFRLR